MPLPAIPEHYKCPITTLIMRDPVSASDGNMYEREAIAKWMQENNMTSPLNRAKLDGTLHPNQYFKTQINEFLEANPEHITENNVYLPRSLWLRLRDAIAKKDLPTFKKLTTLDPRLLSMTPQEGITAGITYDGADLRQKDKHIVTFAQENGEEDIIAYCKEKLSAEFIEQLPEPQTRTEQVSSVASNSASAAPNSAFFAPAQQSAQARPNPNSPIEALAQHVAYGEQDEAEAMLRANPDLLTQTATITMVGYSGRTVSGTPLQIAMHEWDDDMWQMMEPYFNQLPNGQIEKARQIQENYPNALEAQVPYDFSAIIAAIDAASNTDIESALNKEQNNTPLCQALNSFRRDFTEHSMQESPYNLQNIYSAFTHLEENWNNWSGNQCDLFWCQVIGFTQRFVPACYAQAFAQDLYYITEEGEKLKRTLNYRHVEGSFYPLSSGVSGLGFDCGARRGGPFGGLVWGWVARVEKHVKQKLEAWRAYAEHAAIAHERSVSDMLSLS